MTTTPKESGPARGRPGAETVVCLQRVSDGYRMLVARTGRDFSILEARPVPEGDKAAVLGAVTRYAATKLIRILPGSHAICRVMPAPGAAPELMAESINLLAEAELPETLPRHRRAAGLMPGAPGQCLLTGWVAPETPAAFGAAAEHFVATPAALAALIAAGGGAVLYADRTDGSVCSAQIADKRAVVGAAMEPNSSEGAFAARVAARAERLGLEAPSDAGRPHVLLLDDASRQRLGTGIDGARSDPQWLADYGPSLGAAMIAGAAEPLVRSLAGLTAEAPKVREAMPVKAVKFFAEPRHAWGIVAAAAVICLAGPYLIHTTRLSVLTARTALLDSSKEGRELLRKRAALFTQLDNPKSGRLPMTKLLHDISRVAPVGVAVPNIRVSPEQGLSLQGTAEKDELVNVFQAALTSTKLFSNVKLNRKERAASGVEFDISADIVQPHLAVSGEDYAKESLAVRLYGANAVNTATAAPKDTPAATRKADRPRREPEGDEPASAGARRPAASEPTTPPPPLTEAEIAKMDRGKVMAEFASRRSYVQKNQSLDAATKQRLEEEVSTLRQKLSGGGS
ncbi:MAG: PilN domain-containing protein [Phycisphaerales bacterium]